MSSATSLRRPRWVGLLKPAVGLLCLLPAGFLVLAAFNNDLGPNPAETLIRSTGDWTLRLLCATLAITPLRILLGRPELASFRRMLGLFTFFYGTLHFLCYGQFDMEWVLDDIWADVLKRPFIAVGSLTLLLMLPLALTSFNQAIKALGGRRWQQLHRLVYLLAPLAILHFLWMRAGKNDFSEVALYALIVGGLLGWRLVRRVRRGRG